jgi:hypothetical protein
MAVWALSCGGTPGGEVPADAIGEAEAAAPALTVFDFSPKSGDVAGGTAVILSGVGFLPGVRVYFGPAQASGTTFFSASELQAVSPPAAGPGAVDLRVLNPDGAEAVLSGGFSYTEVVVPRVDWCRLVYPPEYYLPAGQPSEPFIGRVRLAGVTDAAGQGAGLVGQVGFGPRGTDPRSAGGWSFVDAAYTGDADGALPGDRTDDEYAAPLTIGLPGAWALAFRFSADGGGQWAWCDLDGADAAGFSPEALGDLTVTPTAEIGVSWCALAGPAQAAVDPGQPAGPFTAHVYGAGLTVGAGQGAGVQVELGVGPPEQPPEGGAGWEWKPASYTGDLDGTLPGDLAFDAYAAGLQLDGTGAWAYAFRASSDGGTTWRLCDLDGSDNGVSQDQLGRLRVGRFLEWCRADVPAEVAVHKGQQTPVLAAAVYGAGITDGAGAGGGITSQVGFGPAEHVDPGVAEWEGWSWTNATFQSDADGLAGPGADDVYVARLEPDREGAYVVAFRFSWSGGGEVLLCDRSGSADGFSVEDLGALLVQPPEPATVDSCRLEGPLSLQAKAGKSTPPITGLVYVGGVTPGTGPGAAVLGALGVRDTGGAWLWKEAAYLGDADGQVPGDKAQDRFSGKLNLATPGTYAYAYRFSADLGQTWTVCDSDGSDNGFSDQLTGQLTVYQQVVPVISDVTLVADATLAAVQGWHTPLLAARVDVPGLTENPGQVAELQVQVGAGPVGSIPALGQGWHWAEAAFAESTAAPAGYDEYRVALAVPDPGQFDVAARASLDGTTWVYGDLDGSSNGYALPAALGVVAPAVSQSVQWCRLVGPVEAQVQAGQPTADLEGEVFLPGCSEAAGWCPGLVAQVGYGPQGSDAFAAGWAWEDAWYEADQGTNDGYAGRLLPVTAGVFATAFRFSTDAGVNWTACDTTGTPFQPARAGTLTVTEP